MSHIVIIGSGHAGLTLARELRMKDAECKITLLSKEAICAYYKPNLSKALSSGKTADQLILKTTDSISTDLDLHCISHVDVTDIDSTRLTCTFQSIENKTTHEIQYDKLVLAMGASPIRLPASVTKTDKILHINNLNDYRLFRDQLEAKQSVAIIGAGYIGCELASDLSSQGIKVSIIDRGAWPLSRAVPEALGSIIQEAMSSQQNISWYLGKTLEMIQEVDNKFIINLSSEMSLEADLVISAIGLQANTGLAKKIGAKTGLGIQVDAYSQTSLPNIYALGDCAEYQEKLLPFIAPITLAARLLARTLTDEASELILPANAVPVKISACPTVICPSSESRGIWEVQGSGSDLEAHFLNEFGELTGFALTGSAISRKMELLKICKGLLASSPPNCLNKNTALSQAS
jgi:rubredoxin-NAD+ reductase